MGAFLKRWGLDAQLALLVIAAVFLSVVGVTLSVNVMAMFQKPEDMGSTLESVPVTILYGTLLVIFLFWKWPFALLASLVFWSVCFRLLSAQGLSRRRAAQVAAAATGFGFWVAMFLIGWDDASQYSWKRDLRAMGCIGSICGAASALAATMVYRPEPKLEVETENA